MTPGVKSYDFHLEPICWKFLNKKSFSEHSFGANFKLEFD